MKLVYLYFLLLSTTFCQTNDIINPDFHVQRLEDMYFLKIVDKEKINIKLSGRVLFDMDQFGTTKRIISYPAIKITF